MYGSNHTFVRRRLIVVPNKTPRTPIFLANITDITKFKIAVKIGLYLPYLNNPIVVLNVQIVDKIPEIKKLSAMPNTVIKLNKYFFPIHSVINGFNKHARLTKENP